MHLQEGTRSHFMKFLDQEFPSMVPRYERLYEKKYPPIAYRKEVQAMVRTLQDRYGLIGREEAKARQNVSTIAGAFAPDQSPEPEQVGFAW